MTIDNNERSFYCSIKFRYLKIDLESNITYNCHAAEPHPINFQWLSNNSGNLFNTPVNVMERNMMLNNQRNSSCEQNCWRAEDVGAVSPRMYQKGQAKTHTHPTAQPETIELTIGADCNLTCSYCCKEFSTAWRRDLASNGNYDQDSDRFKLSDKDKVLMKVSQPERKQISRYQILLDEIRTAAPLLKKLVVTGGEPFLDNDLMDTIVELPLPNDCEIQIYTGLGVSNSRFEKILSRLKSIRNLYLTVSAECTDEFYEFNRYGTTWNDAKHKIELIRRFDIKYNFQATLSNLTVFGFAKFAKQFKDDNITVTFAYQPDMMAPYVLDSISKQTVLEQLQELPDVLKNTIIQSLGSQPTDVQRQSIGKFLKEFASRRHLDVTIYPKHFLNWMDYVV